MANILGMIKNPLIALNLIQFHIPNKLTMRFVIYIFTFNI